jgi:DNA-binding beta-propeller fold protein YncE
MAFGPDGNVYVTDLAGHRVQVFTIGGSLLRAWGTYGSGNGEFNQPYGIAFDAMGRIYVTDKGNHRVQVFTLSGAYIGQWGSLGSGPGQFDAPAAIAIDAAGNVFVSDAIQNRIQKFGWMPTAALQRTWGGLKLLYHGDRD